MGRLDDAAKHKVVELRKAGLSFRKIKAVLELENIKVSAQAIYLYLREFQGRPPGRVRPLEAQTAQAQAGALQERWSNIHLQNLMRDGPHRTEYAAPTDFSKQASTTSETTSNSSGSGEASRPEQQSGGNKEENDIQIVSVTSLAQHGQQRATQPPVTRPDTSSNLSSTLAASGAFLRRRVTPSPATSSILAARKRLLDRALSHRTKSFHQMAALLRRDQAGVQSSDLSSALPQQPETYDLTTEKTVMEEQPGHNGSPRRFAVQRPGMSVRSLHLPPRVGIRLPNRPPAPLTSSAPGPVLRLPSPRTQGAAARSEGNSNPPSAVQDTRARGSLQDQIQTLGSEVRSLGLAVKMMVEQQCRLEREQSQQTQIQKQILSTLQTLSSKAGLCSRTPQRLNKTPSPSSLPAASATTSFGQETYTFSQGTFSHCGQTQPGYNTLERLESVEAFKVPGMSPPSINGFPPCSNADSLPLTHTSSQSQTYPAAYQQQNSQALLAPYTQSYVSSYNHTHTQSFRTPESKAADFSARTFTDCSGSTQQVMNSSPHNQPLSSIKVEGP
ncbi:PREDICTED: uncharacterized protein LOC106915760 [Poecilia mexicana]|uniref:uncharacterized protein LOC106915760 n=1 Tax=Poecilia mexicana TaxID=48701 RepID=UPI00072E6532|nr:PREDICTED: uncharacterized protein LOC106915760 [Poecilia mexicana]XP_014839069.1 PREDICTED: uncharacterized protein LOC106915760 [Poecilia mexicana]